MSVVLFSNTQIQQQFDLSMRQINPDEDHSNTSLSGEEVLRAHYLISEFFLDLGEGIGGIGVKDMNLLMSALSRQNACFDGVCKYEGVFEIAASLLYGLVKNHPFYDANKRTAFLSVLYYLHKQNYTPSISEKKFENFLVEVADDQIKLKRRYKDNVRKGVEAPEVEYIVWFLRRSFRKIDKQQYLLSYRELAKKLREFGFDLKYPSNGSISVIKYRPKILKNPFSKTASAFVEQKVGTIAYPGDGKQVGRTKLKQVRELTGLTIENGYDSQVFYRDVDPLGVLIAKYEAPLRRLANR
jgi:death-on-curing protein